ncbi:MAG: HD domain-containing protein [Candidatus Helarchaeota archaeon]
MNNLEKIFSNVSFEWIDDNRIDIINSEVFKNFVDKFPKLKKIFFKSMNLNKPEFERTIRHTIRLLVILFQLKNDNFKHKSMNNKSIQKIKTRIDKIQKINPKYLPLILILHDIGRPVNRKLHTYESAKIIKENNLLDEFDLKEQEKLLIIKVIEYHLLIGTIYTGESTYYAFTTLLNDAEFSKSLDDKEFSENFLLLSTIFTILDPLGYFYTQIFDHYIEKYAEIERKLKEILFDWPDIRKIQQKLREKCFKRLDWRLACALRIFQNIGTKPQLTYDFFIEKIKKSVGIYLNQKINDKDWEQFKKKSLSHTYLIQLKYALAVLMIIASGEFKRIFKPKTVNPSLIDFWVNLNKKIVEENEKSKFKDQNWIVIFDGLPHWSKFKGLFSKIIDKSRNKSIIENASVKYDNQRMENWLVLNFNLENER